MYQNESKYDEESEDDYSLNVDYYSEDIEMVRKSLKDEEDIICKYVCSSAETDTNKFDVLNDTEMMKSKIADLTDLRNTPLGKWPSQYNLAFMQQLAVNIETSKNLLNESVFSVNGPPGTGKTTLLKEIIADNIVQRAKVLSQYDDPDDLFNECDFFYGPGAGKEKKAYSRYSPHWYSLNNSEVNKYSILIASSNNNAVENITKELPKSKGITDISNNKNVWISADKYKEVSELFNHKKGIENGGNSRDIYFNDISKKYVLEELKEECWGLIGAPLGKRKNINNYYWKYLKPIIDEMRKKDEDVSENYELCRKKFIDQYAKVLTLQEKFNKIKLLRKEITTEDIDSKIQGNELAIDDLVNKNNSFENKLEENDIHKLERYVIDLNSAISKSEDNIKILSGEKQSLISEVQVLKKQFEEVKKTESKFEAIFKKEKHKKKIEQENDIQESIVSKENLINKKIEQLTKEKEKKNEFSRDLKTIEDKIQFIKQITDEYSSNKQKIKILNDEIDELLKNKKQRESEIANLNKEKEEIRNYLYNQAILITSKKISDKKKAHINNLWLTEEYDVERMKLFYYAIEFNKQFVLSSYRLNKNLVVLGSFWGYGEEKIKYNPEDMKLFTMSLYQSLFLVTPVISTTFASLGNMFQYVQGRNAFGTLIVDEAGQAEPKMLLGALYRCNKAMIVGDPKQIEPVLNDDTNKLCKGLLKNLDDNIFFSDNESVQSYADRLNKYGTVLNCMDQETGEWVGLPLVVHRRCNSPMFEISNLISYGGVMVKETVNKHFEKGIYNYSKWIEVYGKEAGKKNHYVEEQGTEVIKMLQKAKNNGSLENVFVISPFKTVADKIKEKAKGALSLEDSREFWDEHIGTVHTFQGKEADEVIFVLGCDENSLGAVKWVSSNIVNVAASRAKQRFYIVGSFTVWKNNRYVLQAKNCLDLETFRKIVELQNNQGLSETERNKELKVLLNELPSKNFRFSDSSSNNELDNEADDTYEKTIQAIIPEDVISDTVLKAYGFSNLHELDRFSEKTKLFLKNGLLIYSLLLPLMMRFKGDTLLEIDVSSCAIEFAKALESQARETFFEPIKTLLPDWTMKKGKHTLYAKDAKEKEFTLGVIRTILDTNKNKKFNNGNFLRKSDKYQKQFIDCLQKCTELRNDTSHSEIFSTNDSKILRKYGFALNNDTEFTELSKGLIFEMLELKENYQKELISKD